MPAVTIAYPQDFFTADQKTAFKMSVMQIVATNMDAVNPISGERTQYGKDPKAYIDLILVPYAKDDAAVTTPLVATIVTYVWPDRMADIGPRIESITNQVRASLPPELVQEGQEIISFTFLGKELGAWCAA